MRCRSALAGAGFRFDHGETVAATLGYTPLYLRYNSGLHISINGREFARQLEALLAAWPRPVERLVLLGHSMGGLLAGRYVAEGLASWYGTKFHGRATSNGEAFDMYTLTAAHKSLPIPSYVRVTNVANGRSVVVRVNDRGPFHSLLTATAGAGPAGP